MSFKILFFVSILYFYFLFLYDMGENFVWAARPLLIVIEATAGIQYYQSSYQQPCIIQYHDHDHQYYNYYYYYYYYYYLVSSISIRYYNYHNSIILIYYSCSMLYIVSQLSLAVYNFQIYLFFCFSIFNQGIG